MKEFFSNQRNLSRSLRQFLVLSALVFMPLGAWADYFDIAIQYGTEESNFHSVLVTEDPTDILGDGTMSYDQDNNILTLNGVNLTCSYGGAAFIVHNGFMDSEQVVTVRLVGSNTITLGNDSYFYDGIGITFIAADNNASLKIITQDGRTKGIFSDRATPTYSDDLAYYFSSSEIKYAEKYSLWICGTQVTDANKDDILGDGKWSYVHDSGSWLVMELTLHGVSIENYSGNVISTGSRLTIKIDQGSTNTISCADGYYPFYSDNESLIYFDAYLDGTITGTNRNPFSYNCDYCFETHNSYYGPTLYFTQNGYTIAPGTNQWGNVEINNSFLYDENHADVFGDGSVSVAEVDNGTTINFTLNNANFRGPITTEEYENVVVDLTGVNYIRVIDSQDIKAFYRSYGGDYTLTFTGDGELRLIDEYITSAYDPFTSHCYSDDLHDASANFTTGGWAKEYVTPTDGSEPYLRIYKGTPTKYDLWIRDTQVTSENASNIFASQNEYGYSDGEGLASFAITNDTTTGEEIYTLTLNNTTIYDFQEMSIIFKYPKLTVHLIGENHIVNGFSYYGQSPATGTVEFTSDGGEENCLIFDSAENVEDLSNPDYYVGFSHCSYNEISDETGWTFGMYEDPEYHQQHLKLYKKDPSSGANEKYDLWIGDIQVNEKNCTDILGDGNASQTGIGSFQYVPSLNKLFITNSTDNLDIRSEINDSLTIYLAPKSSNAVGNIAYTGNGNAKLIITTDGNYPGVISLSANADVISGFSSLTLEQNLVIMEPEDIDYDAGNRRLAATSATIGVPLSPITKETYIQPNGAEIVPNADESDINKVVDDILYTLGDTEDPEGDGFDDGGFIVINTVTSDHEAAEAAKDYTPGTEDFMEHLKGMTFLVPAGKGKINLDIQTMDDHILKVKIGDAVPNSIEKTERGVVEIPYNVGEPTYVYLYNGGPAAATARSKAIGKGGKKKVTHVRVYTIGVAPAMVKSANSVDEASGGAYTGDFPDLEGQEVMSDEEIEAAMGDVDGDGKQTAKDITEMVKAIMGLHSGVYDDTNADMNDDGEVNITDIIQIVNKIE